MFNCKLSYSWPLPHYNFFMNKLIKNRLMFKLPHVLHHMKDNTIHIEVDVNIMSDDHSQYDHCKRTPKVGVCSVVSWPQVESRLPHSEKLKSMIKQGIPHSMRPQIWLRISGALETRNRSDTSYKDVVKASSNDNLMTSKQIEKVGLIVYWWFKILLYVIEKHF